LRKDLTAFDCTRFYPFFHRLENSNLSLSAIKKAGQSPCFFCAGERTLPRIAGREFGFAARRSGSAAQRAAFTGRGRANFRASREYLSLDAKSRLHPIGCSFLLFWQKIDTDLLHGNVRVRINIKRDVNTANTFLPLAL